MFVLNKRHFITLCLPSTSLISSLFSFVTSITLIFIPGLVSTGVFTSFFSPLTGARSYHHNLSFSSRLYLHLPPLLSTVPSSTSCSCFHPLLTRSLPWWLEVSGTVSQGHPCPRSGLLMPGWLSGTDSTVPVGDHQTFSASDHWPPWWIGLMCILSLSPSSAVHYKECDSQRKTGRRKEVAGGTYGPLI